MSESEAPETKRNAQWVVAATCCALVLLVVSGGVFAMRDRLLVEARQEAREQTNEREKLSRRIDALQSSFDNLSSAAKPDGDALAALTDRLTETNTKLDALAARIETLEKKVEEKKPEPAAAAVAAPAPTPAPVAAPQPVSGASELLALKLSAMSGRSFASELAAWSKLHPEAKKETETLSTVAESGIPSEADLNQKLREAIDNAVQSKKVDDVSLAGKINTHLAGLVSIKKTNDSNAYATLRKDVLRDDIPTLMRSVEGMDATTRAPLEEWLKTARNRADALAALNALDSYGGHN